MEQLPGKKAKDYSRIKTRNLILDILISVIAIVSFQLFFSRNISSVLNEIGYNFYICCFFYACIFLMYLYLVGLPLSYYNTYIVEHRFSLSRQSKPVWVKDELKGLALSIMVSILCIEAFYFVLRIFPETWWIIASFLWIIFTVVLARIFPVLLIPIFYKYSSINDETLKSGIIKLSQRAGIVLLDVCKIDFSKKTSKANAALVGLGKTRKVVLADTLIENFSEDEIVAVVAHEFGHYKFRHMFQLLMFNAVTTVAGFYILYLLSDRIVAFTQAQGIADLYLMPLLFLLLIVSGIVLMPVQNYFSRFLEKQADMFSLEAIDSPSSFISAMSKLAEVNLAEIDPPLLKKIFLYSHPTIKERILMAEAFNKHKVNDNG